MVTSWPKDINASLGAAPCVGAWRGSGRLVWVSMESPSVPSLVLSSVTCVNIIASLFFTKVHKGEPEAGIESHGLWLRRCSLQICGEKGRPTYAPKGIQVVVCNHRFLEAEIADEALKCCITEAADVVQEGWNCNGNIWASRLYPVRNEPSVQRFELPPVFAANALVQVLQAYFSLKILHGLSQSMSMLPNRCFARMQIV